MKNIIFRIVLSLIIITTLYSCNNKNNRNDGMINLLATIQQSEFTPDNNFASSAKLKHYDSLIQFSGLSHYDSMSIANAKARTFLELGEEQKAVAGFESVLNTLPNTEWAAKRTVMRDLAMAYLRLGERTNCVHNHSAESCIFPINGNGVHGDKTGSKKAIELYEFLVSSDSTDIESRWLLNIAYMTIGGYPQKVPSAYLIKNLDAESNSSLVKPFVDVALNIGFIHSNMAGGNITDDFNNDGYLDIITSNWQLGEGMHYCSNNGNGTFTDISEASGLAKIGGGLNMMQTDYNNDGLKDIFILRGAWKGEYGNEPNSLLKNNGDGTFTDVTKESGLLSFHPTQTATWADFNNDGWLDVFIGNETSGKYYSHPCELFMNNKNGTFREVAVKANCAIVGFVKGVTSADYDNDGLPDIFISRLDGNKILLKNEGEQNGTIRFKDVTEAAGLNNKAKTFPTWFWDYDNDGWQDLLVCSYDFTRSLAWYAGAEALKMPIGNSGKIFLFRNKHDGTFEDVSEKVGLNKIAFAMGANFGDIDNDGYPDFYLGTGNPHFQSLVPNKMFKNIGGEKFADITTAAHVGNLQKGHGVSFADLDNDGDEDIFIEIGGAYVGDSYTNSLYVNPGQNNNHWISLSLEGVTCNKVAIGAKIKVTFKEDNKLRSVYSIINSGGSFGANPLTQHIGIGKATNIESVEIVWPGSKVVQALHNIKSDEFIKIKQGSDSFSKITLKSFDFLQWKGISLGCAPPVKI